MRNLQHVVNTFKACYCVFVLSGKNLPYEKAQVDKERKASVFGVACLIDPGSNAHLTNVRGVLEPGSAGACYAEVQGLSGKGQALVARTKGKFVYKVGKERSIVLNDVLYVPDAVLSSTMNEPMVLVSSGKMARRHGIGTHFVAGGNDVEYIRDNRVVGGFNITTNCDNLYVDRRGQTDSARERRRLLAECATVFVWKAM